MSAECVVCHGPSIVFLCQTCSGKLRRQLLEIPTLVAYLEDAAVGHTRLGDPQAGRSGQFEAAAIRYDSRAADLAVEIHRILSSYARGCANMYGLAISPPVTWHRPTDEYRYCTKDYATFLAANVERLARLNDIGDLCGALKRHIKHGLSIINRGIPPQFCGPCPGTVTRHDRCEECTGRDHDCGTRLMAARGAVEVTCPLCTGTHKVEKLTTQLLARADHHRCTIAELHRVLRMLNEPVALSTLYRWAEPRSSRRGSGQLKPAGYLRADKKSIGLTKKNANDQAVYRVSEARRRRRDNDAAKRATREKRGV